MSKPLISVIMPTYNRLPVLAEGLESLSRQTFSDFEVIVVNDAGDPVNSVLESYPELNIQLLNMKSNGGHVKARNEALNHVQGEYILLLDDDDLILPGHMERMLAAAQEGDVLYSDAEIFSYVQDESGRVPTKRRLFAYEQDPALLRKYLIMIPSGTLYRREVHDTIGPFDEQVGNYWDWDFFLRVTSACRVKRIPVASTLYAFNADSGQNLSATFTPARNKFLEYLCEKHQLGTLGMENFYTMLDNPELQEKEVPSQQIWDGQRLLSRWNTRK
ncbi:glycosyltransferase family 2 protein [Marinicrinis lubricantis]|uniref:Glycosyltransferase family 2 protein n=1 Tax=Marinicrinis lubricantis TaxID=2086470 RepID=A0ABW1IR84_9BACL